MRDTPPAGLRREYGSVDGLAEDDLAPDWWTQFHRWFIDAVAAGLPEPNAMVVATADAQGRPSSRTVLLKGYDERGLVFYTNYGSRKGTEARLNPYASLLLPWFPIQRQVVICGTIGPVDRAETEAYFAGRPRGSQLGAWASPQSEVLADRAALDDRFRAVAQRFPDGVPVPPPPHWGGLRVVPSTVEFWQGRASRLHDRLRYRRSGADDWIIERLAP
ncbi:MULTISPECIES: pyridoxamine 5'-phosphate oxidase [unclassified Plantactinospora]|uniref:pyridoxamine 5'-phosphate oxidase n=1 Tax=unclassified Plantactinospora TaxID=2631981 RepID=UPI000D16D3A4|nr:MULTISPECIES: pyridoxamine 5'-phosphate oxidase [unclassified Plantactinospora]AVT31319.1 pyridoxamine 5'-phosphate oxidase [Plantactinospora sp. BC1]AVT39851.1 pyridoxamine 5'-phosphate oxidase [Plantactinospora sp. BB1]